MATTPAYNPNDIDAISPEMAKIIAATMPEKPSTAQYGPIGGALADIGHNINRAAWMRYLLAGQKAYDGNVGNAMQIPGGGAAPRSTAPTVPPMSAPVADPRMPSVSAAAPTLPSVPDSPNAVGSTASSVPSTSRSMTAPSPAAPTPPQELAAALPSIGSPTFNQASQARAHPPAESFAAARESDVASPAPNAQGTATGRIMPTASRLGGPTPPPEMPKVGAPPPSPVAPIPVQTEAVPAPVSGPTLPTTRQEGDARPSMMQSTDYARNLVKKFEGPKDQGWDYKQYSGPYGVKRAPNERLSLQDAEQRMQGELDRHLQSLDQRYPGLPPNVRAALGSFTYNLGPAWMDNGSNLSKAVQSGDWDATANVLQRYNKAGGSVLRGLVNRRSQEADILTNPSAVQVADASGSYGPSFGPPGAPAAPRMAGGIDPDTQGVVSPLSVKSVPVGPAQARPEVNYDALRQQIQSHPTYQALPPMQQKALDAIIGGGAGKAGYQPQMPERTEAAPSGGRMTPEQDVQWRAQNGRVLRDPLVKEWYDKHRPLTPEEARTDELQRLTIEKARRELEQGQVQFGALKDGERLYTKDARTGQVKFIDAPGETGESKRFKDAYDKERGETLAKAQADYPRIHDNAKLAIDTIEQIRSHPGRSAASGFFGAFPTVPGTEARGYQNLLDQAKGKVFLEAFNSLRGGGQITEAEGNKATQALGRLDRAQTDADFDTALKDLEDVIKLGVERSYRAAKAPATAPHSAPALFPKEATDILRADASPTRRKQFDEIFGPGAADRVLGGR